jgi:sigma-B regulation protein RsbU (phosphoserine phosphatase)
MVVADLPKNEAERIESLKRLNILDTPPEERFDKITHLAAAIFDVPIAYISLVDANRQWFKSRQGIDVCQTSRDISFCSHTVREQDLLVIQDTHKDERFWDNPMVTGKPYARFYAGHPLRSPEGLIVGTLCIMGPEPRFFSDKDREIMKLLAGLVERALVIVDQIEIHHQLLDIKNHLLQAQQIVLDQVKEAGDYLRSMLPSPTSENGVSIDWFFQPSSQLGGDALGYRWLNDDVLVIYLLDVSGHGVGSALLAASILDYLRTSDFEQMCQPSSVFSHLNGLFPMSMHQNKFFTIWYGVYFKSQRTLRYSSAGHPPAILLDHQDRPELLGQSQLMIGAFPGVRWQTSESKIQHGHKLTLISDGVYESINHEGTRGTVEEFAEFLQKHDGALNHQLKAYQKHKNVVAFDDDVSLMRVGF